MIKIDKPDNYVMYCGVCHSDKPIAAIKFEDPNQNTTTVNICTDCSENLLNKLQRYESEGTK